MPSDESLNVEKNNAEEKSGGSVDKTDDSEAQIEAKAAQDKPEGKEIRHEMSSDQKSTPETKKNVQVIETNGIGILDAENAVKASRKDDKALTENESSHSGGDGIVVEKAKSTSVSHHERIADPINELKQQDLTSIKAKQRDAVVSGSAPNETQAHGNADDPGNTSTVKEAGGLEQESIESQSQAEADSANSILPHVDKGLSNGSSGESPEDVLPAEYMSSDACRLAASQVNGTKNRDPERTSSSGKTTQAASDETYQHSDACKGATSNRKLENNAQNAESEQQPSPSQTLQTNVNSDPSHAGTKDGISSGVSEGTSKEEQDHKRSDNTGDKAGTEDYQYSDACRTAAPDNNTQGKPEDTNQYVATGKPEDTDKDPSPTTVKLQAGNQVQGEVNHDDATVMPLAAPPTSQISNNKTASPVDLSNKEPSQRPSSSSNVPAVEIGDSPATPTDNDESLGDSNVNPTPPDVKGRDEPSNTKNADNAVSTLTEVDNISSNLTTRHDESPSLLITSEDSELISSNDLQSTLPDQEDATSNLTESDTSLNLTRPVTSAALSRHSPFSCLWRCRSLLSELRLLVDPPRLLVAEEAAVTVQCRLPTRLGSLTQLTWSFRPAEGSECVLTPTEGGEEEGQQCQGFGEAAQMYFVNQSMTSSRLAIPRVTSALAGHYTCTARVQCCAGAPNPPVVSRALSTYLHVYGTRGGTSQWVVSAAAGICLAIGVTAIVVLKRKWCRGAKKVGGSIGRYRPVPEGRRVDEELQERARLYTGPLGSVEEEETELAESGVPVKQRQQFREHRDVETSGVVSRANNRSSSAANISTKDGAYAKSFTNATSKASGNRASAYVDEEDNYDEEENYENYETRSRSPGLGTAFSSLPETHIARTHAPRPGTIRANPLASPEFRGGEGGGKVVSPRYEIPLTPPDAPPTPPGGPHGASMSTKGSSMSTKGSSISMKGLAISKRSTIPKKASQTTSGSQKKPPTGSTTAPLWRLGAAARK
ncbi:uncharacterized protein LOC122393153 [Amphibalanus amphitrite]|uniref:uncharacterized protein LOC122393153 n=1 Tax=Amphibalanus amphitrite TaxID=1232801 RepID=UPI001C918CD8|nr:uncharacterized protein LOC122393153 [Amphibalanus amphitrite]